MKRIIKYKCYMCGAEYDYEEDAIDCERRHAKYEINEITTEKNDCDFPEKICITHKESGKECKYRIDRPRSDLTWKPFYEISNDIHIGDCYLVKTCNDIHIVIVTGSLSNPTILNFTEYNTEKNIDVYAITLFAKITIPDQDEENEIFYGRKLDKC